MARFLIKECDHLEEVGYTAVDYEVAIETCIEKGWLRLLSAEDVAGRNHRHTPLIQCFIPPMQDCWIFGRNRGIAKPPL